VHAPSDNISKIQGFSSDLMQYALEREHGRQKGILWRRARALSKSFQTTVDESMFSAESVNSLKTAGRAFCDDVVVGTTTLVPVVQNAGIKRMLETENLAELTAGLYEYLYDEATQVSILLFLAKYINTPQLRYNVPRLQALMSAARFHRTITHIMRVHTNHRRLQRAGVEILYCLPSPDKTILTKRFAVVVVNTIAFAMQKFLKSFRIQRMGLRAICGIVQSINQTFDNSYIFTRQQDVDLLAILAESMTSQLGSLFVLEEFAKLCSSLMGNSVHTDYFINVMCASDDRKLFSTGEKEFIRFIPIAEDLILTSMDMEARATRFDTLEDTNSMAWKETSTHRTVISLLLKIARTYPDQLRQVDRIIKCVADTLRYYPTSNDHATAAINLLSLFLFQTMQRFPNDRHRTTVMQNTVFSSGIINVIGKLVLHMLCSVNSCATCVKVLQLVCDVCHNNPGNYQKINASNMVALLVDTYGPRMLENSTEHPFSGDNFFGVPLYEVKMMMETKAAWAHVLGLLEQCGFEKHVPDYG